MAKKPLDELETMRAIDDLLAAQPELARRRILEWVNSKDADTPDAATGDTYWGSCTTAGERPISTGEMMDGIATLPPEVQPG